ncbi:DUF3987 domain-containing protein [Meiothermus rufus]|uniref:DUF3987 domain-containing protein n=1 Tax=Meiothermus rufus TaxID=604332 RepID=UPI00041B0DE0|nr:DUF3987 domain-containing protein [Meiothermus rufus]
MTARDLLQHAPEVTPERVWPEPEPLDDLDTPTPPAFDALKLLPEPLGPWAEDTAARMNAPVEFTVTAALVAAAGVLGNRVLVAPDPEANPGWLEAPNLWGLLVGEPGTRKSPVMEAAFAPLHALEAELHRENQRRRTEWELARRNRKKGDPVTEDDLQPPAEEALLAHDITAEKLADLLEHNPFGLTAFQDELLGLIAAWERPEKAGERQFYLKLWNGLSPHTVRRIQRGSHYLSICTLSLLGGAQPGPMRRYILEAARGWNNDGLLHRFQLTVYGELPPYQRVVRPPNSLKAEYTARLEGLAGLARQLPGVPQVELRPELTRPVLTFDPEAQALYLQWLEGTARESRQPSTPTLKRSLLEKQTGLVPKLALLLHLVEGYPNPQPHIEALSTARAIALANLYKLHTLNLWQEAIRPEVQGAALLGRRILERTQTKAAFSYRRFSERDILRSGWKGLAEPETVRRALAELEARGWIAREGSAWVPNPRLWEGSHV